MQRDLAMGKTLSVLKQKWKRIPRRTRLLLLLLILALTPLFRLCVDNFIMSQERASAVNRELWFNRFSSEFIDPAAYWGRFSVSAAVKHDRFDKVMYTPYTDRLASGYLVLGMRDGQTVCYWLDAGEIRRLGINDKVFRWIHLGPLGRPKSQYRTIAKGLTAKEVDDLQALADLLWNKGGLAKLRKHGDYVPSKPLQFFVEAMECIAQAKLKLASEASSGATSTQSAPKSEQ
jgi:hypothetical protein